MRVTLRLFAVARQRAGRPALEIVLPEPATVGDLKRAVAAQVPELEPLLPSLLIAVDNEYAADDHPIGAGSELAAIPPVSGGGPPSDRPDDCRSGPHRSALPNRSVTAR